MPKKRFFSTVASVALIITFGLSGIFTAFEPGLTNAANSVNDSVVVTLMVVSGISITHPDDAPMSTNIDMNQNTAIASSTWNVKTINTAGYSLTVEASSNPAMQASSTAWIADAPATPAVWATALGTATSTFAFGAYGTDAISSLKGDTQCWVTNGNTPSATLKWRGFTGTTPIQTATRASVTDPSGIDTTVCYAAGQNGVYIPSGSYSATVTATAVNL